MSELQLPYCIEEDAKARTEWICKRTNLAKPETEYVTFQIKEAVTRALREANEDNKQPEKALPLHNIVVRF